jgi:hypothetical protein
MHNAGADIAPYHASLFEHNVQATIRRGARTSSLDEFVLALRTPNTLHWCSL